jgi:hypothetical protein
LKEKRDYMGWKEEETQTSWEKNEGDEEEGEGQKVAG